jgi:hypothetical protein
MKERAAVIGLALALCGLWMLVLLTKVIDAICDDIDERPSNFWWE